MYKQAVSQQSKQEEKAPESSQEQEPSGNRGLEHNLSNVTISGNSLQFSKGGPILQMGGGKDDDDNNNDESASAKKPAPKKAAEQTGAERAHAYMKERLGLDPDDYELQHDHPYDGAGNCHDFSFSNGTGTDPHVSDRGLRNPQEFLACHDEKPPRVPVTVFMKGGEVAHSAVGHGAGCMHKAGHGGPVVKCPADVYARASDCDKMYALPDELAQFRRDAAAGAAKDQRKASKKREFHAYSARHMEKLPPHIKNGDEYVGKFMQLQDDASDDDIDEDAFTAKTRQMEREYPLAQQAASSATVASGATGIDPERQALQEKLQELERRLAALQKRQGSSGGAAKKPPPKKPGSDEDADI